MSGQGLTPDATPPPELHPRTPRPSPCLSYWHRTTRAFLYTNINKHSPVPSSVKHVIIGSGIAGALTAFELLEGGVSPSSILILEAREAVSGASGRNAGHVRPDAFRGFSAYAAVHGPEQALKIVANERLVLQRVDEFVKKHNVECDFDIQTTFDVCLTQEFADYEAKSFQAFKEAGGDVSHVLYYSGDAARQKTRVKDAVAAYEWPAASSHPAKLAQWLLGNVIARGVRLFTHCPALKVTRSTDVSDAWLVHTLRGTITTQKVVHCTNAYAAALLPHLANHMTPNRAQAHSLVPSPAFAAENALQATMSLRYSLHHFYSLIQRKGDGMIILGVSRSNPELSPPTLASRESLDDSSYNAEIVDDALKRFEIIFPDSDKTVHGEGLEHAWTGIIGMTPDSVPYVGPLPELPGQYICAGFNGHGMARIFTCAPGLATLMLGGTWADTGLPECFEYTAERLKRAEQTGGKRSVW